MMDRLAMIRAIVAGALLVTAVPAHAEDVRVLSSVAVKTVLEALGPEFARAGRHTVSTELGIAAALKARIEGGAPFDVAILTPAMLDELAAKGLIDAGPRPIVARSGLGLMVKAGSPKPDVRSVDTFKRTLNSARSVAYVPNSASGAAFQTVLDKLGMSAAIAAKARTATSPEEVSAHIVSGAADLAVLPVSEILPIAGAELGGVFPAEIQSYIVMAAGINARSPRAAAAREFVAFLTSPTATPVITAKGMER